MSTMSETVLRAVLLPWGRVVAVGPGVLLVGGVAGAAVAVGSLPLVEGIGIGVLTLAILFGMVLGNSVLRRLPPGLAVGVDVARGPMLRLGIVLYGLRLTVQQIAEVGWPGALSAVLMLSATFTLAVVLGVRLLRLDRQTAVLIGAGSAICGAAAVLAVAPVVRAPVHKVSVAVATVVVFGTVSMLVYPALGGLLEMAPGAYGIFTGATIHEVAQVVVAGQALGPEAGAAAVVVKMMRVMLLAPVLVALALWLGQGATGREKARGWGVGVPWFAVAFVAVVAVNSLGLLPAPVVAALVTVDTAFLAMAMAALGLRTSLSAIRQAGPRPLLLAALLFGFLVGGGYGVTTVLLALLG